MRRYYGYEIFLYSHRAIAIAFLIVLWVHIQSTHSLSRVLLKAAFWGFLVSVSLQSMRQFYKNTTWDRNGICIARTVDVQVNGAPKNGTRKDKALKEGGQEDNDPEDDDSEDGALKNGPQEDLLPHIIKIRLSRPWRIRPGQYIYLKLLTFKCASIFQTHPFAITWWDANHKDGKAAILYIMMHPQQGWTKRVKVMGLESIFTNRRVWLDGPFGWPYGLQEYDSVLLFASGNGVFAQLPLLKGLTEGLKLSAVKVRMIKLVWQTEIAAFEHRPLKGWMDDILNDETLDGDVSDGTNAISQSTADT
jgi:hypothetical protein